MKFKMIKKMLLIIGGVAAVATAGYAIYKAINKDTSEDDDSDEMFTINLEDYFDPWEIDQITDACTRIIRDTGDFGPFTPDLSLSQIDDIDETDDYVILHSKSKKDYKVTLSRVINQNDYVIM